MDKYVRVPMEYRSPEMQAVERWYWAFQDEEELPPLPEIYGFPIMKQEEGWPVFKCDIDEVGPCWVAVGPLSDDDAWALSIKSGGEVLTEAPELTCGFHTDG